MIVTPLSWCLLANAWDFVTHMTQPGLAQKAAWSCQMSSLPPAWRLVLGVMPVKWQTRAWLIKTGLILAQTRNLTEDTFRAPVSSPAGRTGDSDHAYFLSLMIQCVCLHETHCSYRKGMRAVALALRAGQTNLPGTFQIKQSLQLFTQTSRFGYSHYHSTEKISVFGNGFYSTVAAGQITFSASNFS